MLRHRVEVWIVIAGTFCLSASGACQGESDDLSRLWWNHGSLVFPAAASASDEFEDVCVEALGADWKTWDLEQFAGRVDPAVVQAAYQRLATALGKLPAGGRRSVLSRMELYAVSYRALETLEAVTGPEAFGSAVALVPSVSPEFPRGSDVREFLGKDVGSSLASAELTGLRYDVASRLSQLTRGEIAVVIRDLFAAGVEVDDEP